MSDTKERDEKAYKIAKDAWGNSRWPEAMRNAIAALATAGMLRDEPEKALADAVASFRKAWPAAFDAISFGKAEWAAVIAAAIALHASRKPAPRYVAHGDLAICDTILVAPDSQWHATFRTTELRDAELARLNDKPDWCTCSKTHNCEGHRA